MQPGFEFFLSPPTYPINRRRKKWNKIFKNVKEFFIFPKNVTNVTKQSECSLQYKNISHIYKQTRRKKVTSFF